MNGVFIPPGTHVQPLPAKEQTDWTPFSSHVAFELATLVFKDAELSHSHID